MNSYEWLATTLFIVALLAVVKPFGVFMAKAYQGERTLLSPLLAPCKNILYRICGVDRDEEMGWQRYARALILFNFACVLMLFAILLQGILPPQPAEIRAVLLHIKGDRLL